MEIRNTVAGLNIRSHLVLYNQNEVDGDYTGILFESRRVAPGGKSWFGIVRTGDNGVNDFVFLNRNTADDVPVNTSNEVMRITKAGNVGIGPTNTSNPASLLQLASDSSADMTFSNAGSAGAKSSIFGRKSGGTHASPSAVGTNEDIFSIEGKPHNGVDFESRTPAIIFRTNGSFTSGQVPPTKIQFMTNTAGSSATERMTITSSGNVGIGTTSPGVKLELKDSAINSPALFISNSDGDSIDIRSFQRTN
ncbi:hypothetical protein J4204_01985, partial [Candidatus Woesearchaeota archaeon]|nr:hypothetical protein [Candidatus Woesearchaeota archaeon]